MAFTKPLHANPNRLIEQSGVDSPKPPTLSPFVPMPSPASVSAYVGDSIGSSSRVHSQSPRMKLGHQNDDDFGDKTVPTIVGDRTSFVPPPRPQIVELEPVVVVSRSVTPRTSSRANGLTSGRLRTLKTLREEYLSNQVTLAVTRSISPSDASFVDQLIQILLQAEAPDTPIAVQFFVPKLGEIAIKKLTTPDVNALNMTLTFQQTNQYVFKLELKTVGERDLRFTSPLQRARRLIGEINVVLDQLKTAKGNTRDEAFAVPPSSTTPKAFAIDDTMSGETSGGSMKAWYRRAQVRGKSGTSEIKSVEPTSWWGKLMQMVRDYLNSQK